VAVRPETRAAIAGVVMKNSFDWSVGPTAARNVSRSASGHLKHAAGRQRLRQRGDNRGRAAYLERHGIERRARCASIASSSTATPGRGERGLSPGIPGVEVYMFISRDELG
jgi:hypothetical protein